MVGSVVLEWRSAAPRDLFDVRRRLEQEGVTDGVRRGAIASFVSHRRPIAELANPARKDQRETFPSQFEGMPFEPFTYDDHQATLERLINTLRDRSPMTIAPFLLYFEAGGPARAAFRSQRWLSCPRRSSS